MKKSSIISYYIKPESDRPSRLIIITVFFLTNPETLVKMLQKLAVISYYGN